MLEKSVAYLSILRPSQWLKNLMLMFPPFLGGSLLAPGLAGRAVLPLTSFCAISSAVYILNDIVDRSTDLHHPVKQGRPIPSGRVSLAGAGTLAAVLAGTALGAAWQISSQFLFLIVFYIAVSLLYTFRLKQVVLADLFCIASGFIIRLLAGGEAFGISISEWLFLSVFLLALFLSTGKRLSEKASLGTTAALHRSVLDDYPAGYLEGIMFLTGSTVLVTYTMYTITRHSTLLIYTVPLCCFGLFRFILRIMKGKGGDPTESLLKDPWLLLVGLTWAGMVGWGIYGP